MGIKKVLLSAVIKRSSKNSRFLIKYDNKYGSAKLPNEYELGTEIEISDEKINDIDFKDDWLKKISSWKNKKYKLLENLSKYKINRLNVIEDGFWENKEGDKIYYSHILPEEEKEKNIIESHYTESIKSSLLKKESEIHHGFKNLNSSQAFAFNFFQPIIDEDLFHELDTYATKLTAYEYEKRNDDETQFDFYLESNNLKYSFEVKYTEDEFGIAPNDYRHMDKWENYYKAKIEAILNEELAITDFFDEYQLWRNICFSEQGYEVRFVFPKFRNDLAEKVEVAKGKCKENYKKKIKIIYVDDFIDKMINSNNSNLKKHYEEFKQKYLSI